MRDLLEIISSAKTNYNRKLAPLPFPRETIGLARSSHREIVDRSAELTGLVDGPWERARSVPLYVRTRDEARRSRIGEITATTTLGRSARRTELDCSRDGEIDS